MQRGTKKACTLAATGLALAIGVSSASVAAGDPLNVIKYRQTTMKAIGAHMGAIVAVIKGEVPFADQVATHARAIHGMAKHLHTLFPEGTGPEAGETRALPAIWEQGEKFREAVGRLQAESAKLAEIAANGGDLAAVGAQVGALGKNGCGGCHKPFRKPK